MKKMPLIVLMILISMVLISGLSDRDRHPGDFGPHEMFTPYKESINKEMYGGTPLSVPEEKVKPMDEREFLENNIQKSDKIIPRLEDFIEQIDDSGQDVTDLEEMSSEYSSLVFEASSYLEMADSSYSRSEEQRYVALSRERMMQSDILLKKIFVSIRSQIPGSFVLYEDNSLDARGDGVIILSGDLDVNLGISSGEISVVDFKGDMIIDDAELTGQEATLSTVSGSTVENPRFMMSYEDVQGNISLSGSGLTIAAMVDNAILHVTGIGEVQLYGNGNYYLENSSSVTEGVWLSPIFETL